MSKGRKIALTVLAALAIIIVGQAFIVPLLFDIDHFRPQVTAQIQEETGKPVQIGHLALTLLPRVAIRVDDFSMGNPAGFPAGDLIKAKEIHAAVNVSALLNHKVEITSLRLDDLTIDMLEDAHGKWNFENPPAKIAAPPGTPPTANRGAAFTLGVISRLTIAGGEFKAANLLAPGGRGPSLMEVHGASIDLRQVNLDAMATAALREPVSAPGAWARLTGMLHAVAYAADINGPAVAEGTIKADEMDFAPLVVTKFKSRFRLFPKQVYFDDLDLNCYGGSARGNLSLNFGGANLAYGADVQLKGVNVEKFLAAFPQSRGMMTGTLDGSANMSGLVHRSPDPLAGVSGSGQAIVKNGRLPSLQLGSNLRALTRIASVGPSDGDPSAFSSLATDFHIADSRLSSNKITMVGNGMDVDGSGSMTMAGEGTLDYRGEASLAANGNNPLASLLGGLAGARFSHGKMIFAFTVGGTISKPKFGLKGRAGGAESQPGQPQQPASLPNGLSGLFKKKKQQ